MANHNGHNQRLRPPRERLLRDRFARFLGESNGGSRHRKSPNGAAPLWGFVQDQHLITNEDAKHGSHGSLSRLIQLAINEVFERIRLRSWDAYVVGGTLRDLVSDPARAGARVFPRDIDVVVVGVTLQDLEGCFSDLVARRTRFGGLHLVKKIAQVCEVHFDVWPLADTWAIKEYGMSPEISRFPSTPFFNLDAVAIELHPRAGRTRTIYENGFYHGITSKLIDINFEPNPYPDVCVIRALIMAAKLQFVISPRLASFICLRTNQQEPVLNRLQQAQFSHYGQIRCSHAELRSWLDSIQQQLDAGSERIEIRVPQARQLGLWVDYPPGRKTATSGQFPDESNAPPSPSSPTLMTR